MQTLIKKPTKKEAQDVISLRQFNERIPNEEAAIAFAEAQRWGDAPWCPLCGLETVYRVKSGKPMSHRCRGCKKYFSVRSGTVMAETNLPSELLSNLVEIPFQANCRSVRRSRHPVDLAML